MCSRNSKWYRERKKVKCNFVVNVKYDSNKNICEAIITITFPCKQTNLTHDMNKCNPTQFECRIQNLINLLVNRKKLMCFIINVCFCHFKYHKSIRAPLQCDFFNDVYFSLGNLFLAFIFHQLTSEKN